MVDLQKSDFQEEVSTRVNVLSSWSLPSVLRTRPYDGDILPTRPVAFSLRSGTLMNISIAILWRKLNEGQVRKGPRLEHDVGTDGAADVIKVCFHIL